MTAQLKEQIITHPFLNTMSPSHLEALTKNAVEAEFASGDILFHEGEPANRFFLIQNGRIALETRTGCSQSTRVQLLGPGEVLGWSWLFPPFSWHFTARALEPTKAAVLDGGRLLVMAEENPEFGYDLMRRVAQLVIARLQATRKHLVQSTNDHFQKQ